MLTHSLIQKYILDHLNFVSCMWMAAFPGGFNKNHIKVKGKLSELVTTGKTRFSCSCNLKVVVNVDWHYIYKLNTSKNISNLTKKYKTQRFSISYKE